MSFNINEIVRFTGYSHDELRPSRGQPMFQKGDLLVIEGPSQGVDGGYSVQRYSGRKKWRDMVFPEEVERLPVVVSLKRCRICNEEHPTAENDEWETLAGDDPGPNVLAIGWMRHKMTGLDAMMKAMRDDHGAWRCITCLRVVPDESILSHGDGTLIGRIDVPCLVTGYELLCCGADGMRSE